MTDSAQQGKARCDAISVQELLDAETVTVPAYLREQHNPVLGEEPLDIGRYTSRTFFEQEKLKVWPRVWQFVCREEELANPGDHVLYDIVDDSVIVVRGEDGVIRGLINSCLHRGRALRSEGGRVKEFRCPFHAFTWKLDGSFKGMPCEWDFQHLCKSGDGEGGEGRERMGLPQVRVASWKGFVFINFDANCQPLEDYLGVLTQHYAHFPFEKTYKAVHVQKVVPCNWKLGHEAFLEAYHSVATHPQILPYTADANTQYDIYGEHVSRMITPMGVPSPHLGDVEEERIAQSVLDQYAPPDTPRAADTMPPGMSARRFLAEINRQQFAAASGEPLDEATLSELYDAILYGVFPNVQIWAGYNNNLIYQWRPNGDDPNSSIFDIRVLARYPEGGDHPPAVPVHVLESQQGFADAPELGGLGRVFDQDLSNLQHMMKGLKASKTGAVQLASYQESRIRHLHQTLDHYIAAP